MRAHPHDAVQHAPDTAIEVSMSAEVPACLCNALHVLSTLFKHMTPLLNLLSQSSDLHLTNFPSYLLHPSLADPTFPTFPCQLSNTSHLVAPLLVDIQ